MLDSREMENVTSLDSAAVHELAGNPAPLGARTDNGCGLSGRRIEGRREGREHVMSWAGLVAERLRIGELAGSLSRERPDDLTI
jgi:hypothetical protein